ncbi:hypothetical protein TNCV_989691 [Trichonephila clavipes]|nr:hypothetical protein TNCV_989691 [Trichonephila clavipes]
MLPTWRSVISLRLDGDVMGSWCTIALRYSPQPKIIRIKVVGSRGSSCSKMPADDSIITEMAAEHLFHTTDNVVTSTILHKYCVCIPSSNLRRAGMKECCNSEAYRLLTDSVAMCFLREKRTHNEGCSENAPYCYMRRV